MDPNARLNRGDVTVTLNELIRLAQQAGQDRLCLVRRATADRPAVLYILLVGRAAIKAIGPFLQEHMVQQPRKPDGHRDGLEINGSTPLRFVAQWLAETGAQSAVSSLSLGCAHRRLPGLFLALTGETINDDFAARLTARGLLCKLR